MPTPQQVQVLDAWVEAVEHRVRQRHAVARISEGGRGRALTFPLRFVYKVREIGPRRAVTLAGAILGNRLGLR